MSDVADWLVDRARKQWGFVHYFLQQQAAKVRTAVHAQRPVLNRETGGIAGTDRLGTPAGRGRCHTFAAADAPADRGLIHHQYACRR
jgi:hypothetical protein